jgi:hypothetical protein
LDGGRDVVGRSQNDVSVGASKAEGVDSDDAAWQRGWFSDDLNSFKHDDISSTYYF